jgi:hypothetical protein
VRRARYPRPRGHAASGGRDRYGAGVSITCTPLGERTPRALCLTAAGVEDQRRSDRSTWTTPEAWGRDTLVVDATGDPGWGASDATAGWTR